MTSQLRVFQVVTGNVGREMIKRIRRQPDLDLYLPILEAGIDIVTTADWITGHHRNANHPHPSGRTEEQLIQEACERGSSTFYGTGMNPGFRFASDR